MRRALVAGIAAAALVAVGVGSAAVSRDGGDEKPSITVAELTAWEQAILPPLQHGGKIVENGMKAAVNDLQYRHVVPADVIAYEAEQWASGLTQVRGEVMAVRTPELLEPAVGHFVAALDGYVAAAQEFRKAALAPAGPERDRLVASGRSRGEAADDVYNHGGAVVQSLRSTLGLPSSAYFPEPLSE
jgi:hypothetical protein